MRMYDVPLAVGNRILLEVVADEKHAVKSDFLIIPDEANDVNRRALISTTFGKVLQMGGAALESGILAGDEDEVSPGKVVLFLQNSGVSFKHKEADKIYRLITRGDIMAVIGDTDDE